MDDRMLNRAACGNGRSLRCVSGDDLTPHHYVHVQILIFVLMLLYLIDLLLALRTGLSVF